MKGMTAIGLFAVAAVTVVVSGGAATVPRKYRYTGWLSATSLPIGWPTHVLVDGDAGAFGFQDRWNLTDEPVTYKLCVYRRRADRGPCRRGRAPLTTRPSVIPVFIRCCGEYTAKWSVRGRVVATWPFIYIPER